MVIAHGEVLAENGALIREIAPYPYPDFARNTVKVGRTHRRRTISRSRRRPARTASRRGSSASSRTRHRHARARAHARRSRTGWSPPTARRTWRRSRWSSATRAAAASSTRFVSGFGYTTDCAVAATVAHDSHQMIVVGTNRDDMALAANRLQEVGGGFVVVSKGKELALVELPIAGLMSDERAEIVARKVRAAASRRWRSAAARSTMPSCSTCSWRCR